MMQSSMEISLILFGIFAVRGIVEASFLICACNTAECHSQGTDRCIATNLCFAQSEHQSGHGPADVIRGCINRSTPLLCENRPPASVVLTGRAWPLLHCCSSDMCNQDVAPTPPPWFPAPETTESAALEPEFPHILPKPNRKSSHRRKSNKHRKPTPMSWPSFPLVPSASAVPNKTDLSGLEEPYPKRVPQYPVESQNLPKSEVPETERGILTDDVASLFGAEPLPVEIETEQDSESLLTENIPIAVIRETESKVVRKQSVSVEEVSSETEPNWNLLYVVIPGVGVVGLVIALCLLMFIIRRGRYLSTEDLLPVSRLGKGSYDQSGKRSGGFQSPSKSLLQRQLEPLTIVRVARESTQRSFREKSIKGERNNPTGVLSESHQQHLRQSSAWTNFPVQDNRGFADRDSYPKTRSEPGAGFSIHKNYRQTSSAASDCARFPSY